MMLLLIINSKTLGREPIRAWNVAAAKDTCRKTNSLALCITIGVHVLQHVLWY